MPEYDNTSQPPEHPPLDAEDWEIAFEAYKGNTGAALRMGFNLMAIKAYLVLDPPMLQEVLDGLDNAIVALYPYTQFHDVCHEMYIKVVGGELTREEEELLKALGMKF
jgi:hypothetical protein